MSKKEKLVKMELKLKKRHPNNKMRLGKHFVTNVFSEFELSEDEVKELGSVGCKAWFAVKGEKKKEEKKEL